MVDDYFILPIPISRSWDSAEKMLLGSVTNLFPSRWTSSDRENLIFFWHTADLSIEQENRREYRKKNWQINFPMTLTEADISQPEY